MGWEHLIVAVLGGGLASGVVAIVKLPRERDQIIVSAAKDVVVIQRDTLDDVREEVNSLRKQMQEQSEQARQALAACHAERDELRAANEQLYRDRREDRLRLDELEREVRLLRQDRPKTARTRRSDDTPPEGNEKT